MVEREREKR
jgi:hypothetical protein